MVFLNQCEGITNSCTRCKNKASSKETVCKIHNYRYRCEYILTTGKRCGRIKHMDSDKCVLHMDIELPEPEPRICSICYDTLGLKSDVMKMTDCGHEYCSDCLIEWLPIKFTCPVCRGKASKTDIYNCCLYMEQKGLYGIYTEYSICYSFIIPPSLWVQFLEFILIRFTFEKNYSESEFDELIDYMNTDSRFNIYATKEIMTYRSVKNSWYVKKGSECDGKTCFVLKLGFFDLTD